MHATCTTIHEMETPAGKTANVDTDDDRLVAPLEDDYNDAVDAGDFDDTGRWVEEAHRRRRPSSR